MCRVGVGATQAIRVPHFRVTRLVTRAFTAFLTIRCLQDTPANGRAIGVDAHPFNFCQGCLECIRQDSPFFK